VRVDIAMRAEFFTDEAGAWRFRVPALLLTGGGTSDKEDAARQCLAAIELALSGDPATYDAEAEVVTLRLTVDLPG
jgi:hypothetical protein